MVQCYTSASSRVPAHVQSVMEQFCVAKDGEKGRKGPRADGTAGTSDFAPTFCEVVSSRPSVPMWAALD